MAIDEKKLIEDIEEYQEWIFNETIDWFKYEGVFASIYEIIKAQPKLSLETKTRDKWIPCSERLPDEHENYIVTACDECNMIWAETVVVLAEYFEGSWLWYEGGDEYDITDMVIAWMPLPEVYKGEV